MVRGVQFLGAMRLVELCLLISATACATERVDDATVTLPPAPPINAKCGAAPDAGPAGEWRHLTSKVISAYGEPHHRGTDLIATLDDATQRLAGRIAYGGTDKDLEDEDVDVFACVADMWQPLARVRTDEEGRFTLSLTGDQRLPMGMRDLYVSVVGDRSGAAFVGFVGAAGARVVVSDVDGTLTGSENAYPTALVVGGDVPAQPDAAAALTAAVAGGATVVYITTRGDRFTQDTRDWLAANGFPRGPVKMPTSIITTPGDETIEAKTSMLGALAAFQIAAGVGNRHTDVAAYTNAGVPADRIYIKLPEFDEEVADDLAAGRAVGIDTYAGLTL